MRTPQIKHNEFKNSSIDDSSLMNYLVLNIWDICSKIFGFCLFSTSMLSAMLILYVFLIHTDLKTKKNIYLMHYVVATLVIYIGVPLLEGLILLFDYNDNNADLLSTCITSKADGFLSSLPLVFGFLIGTDFFIACYFKNYLYCCKSSKNFLAIAIYIFYLNGYLIFKVACFNNEIISASSITITFSGIIVISKLLLNVIGSCRRPQQNCDRLEYAWEISSCVVHSWIPIILIYFLFDFAKTNKPDGFFSFVASCLLHIFQYGPTITIVSCLTKRKKSFRKAFSTVLWTIANIGYYIRQ